MSDMSSPTSRENVDDDSSPVAAAGADDSPSTPDDSPASVVAQFQFTRNNSSTCRGCATEKTRNDLSNTVSLRYPTDECEMSFVELVQRSVQSTRHFKAWCERCQKFQTHGQTANVTSLPKVLAVSCETDAEHHAQFWAAQQKRLNRDRPHSPVGQQTSKPCRYGHLCTRQDCRYQHLSKPATPSKDMKEDAEPAVVSEEEQWLSMAFDAFMEDGSVVVRQTGAKSSPVTGYTLVGAIYAIRPQAGTSSTHLVTFCPIKSDSAHVADDDWLLYNDITVSRVPRVEVLKIRIDFRLPVMLFYQRTDLPQQLTAHSELNPITWVHLVETESLALRRRLSSSTCVPLDEEELPRRGDLVAIDAEFVTLNQEEAEIRTDGSRTMIKPSQLSVARVTCIRGIGPLEGTPFVDDYISTQEAIADYLTEVSGIRPGDLDKSQSSKHLTTLKTTYLKLRYMVDSGVIFIGHGLKKDFDMINIVVPAEQIRDTVTLYHLSHHRMVSLRFLAWYFLGVKIQSETHDSVEDARTALKLYQKYQQLSTAGPDSVAKIIAEMYDEGERLGWVVAK